jgi:signal transduction histidine kinase
MFTTKPKLSLRRANWAGCAELSSVFNALKWLALGLVFTSAWPPAHAAEGALQLSEAQAQIQPIGQPMSEPEFIKLSHRWDESPAGRSGLDGRVIYKLSLPPTPSASESSGEPRALLFSRIGNQAVVRVNGSVVARWGEPGKTGFDSAKTSWLVTVPSSTLVGTGQNIAEIEVWCQAGRWGGLSSVQYGLLRTVEPIYRQQRFWRFTLPVVMASGFVLMGLTSLALWRRQRVAAYGWFAVACLLGVVRHLDRVWPDVPVPWPAWGALAAAAYACHLMLMFRVGLEMVNHRSKNLHRLLLASMLGTVLFAVLAFGWRRPGLWTVGLFLFVPYGLAAAWSTTRLAWQQRGTAMGKALLVSPLLLAVAGLFDLLVVRKGLAFSQGGNFSVLPLAVFLIAVLMTALIVGRYNASVDAYRELNAELATRVSEREQQLHQAFDSLRASQREQAVQEERQRLMREIHDGVGAQLVLLLNLAAQGRSDPAAIQQQASLALDEMRMAVDSLQPVHGDLGTVLATMRYRLQPRLEAAGLTIRWDVGHLPTLQGLSPQSVLQVHRILLEAMTNVLRHANARTMTITAQPVTEPQAAILVTLTDDGVGMPEHLCGEGARRSQGHGLVNMHTRAEAIGAHLTLRRADAGGTQVSLLWPQQQSS